MSHTSNETMNAIRASAGTTAAQATHPRERLIRTAAGLVQRQGWSVTGINQILTEAGIPKGSFYYYFRSKEALGAAVLQHHYGRIRAMLKDSLLSESLDPAQALTAFWRTMQEGPLASEYLFGCPAANFAAEVAPLCPALLAEADKTLKLYHEGFATVARRARAQDLEAMELAEVATMLLVGALQSVRSTRSFGPLNSAQQAIGRLLVGMTAVASRPARALAS